MKANRFEFLKKDFVQGFPAYCGFEVERAEQGIFETRLQIRPDHCQQDGFVHAGVMATMADHTAGYAAYTTVSEHFRILSIEFKINYFKPAVGDTLVCRAKVINAGKTIIVSESEVFSISKDNEKLVSKATVTLMAVPVENLM
ncbi:PaaI family thioesterase [Thermodesulfobacteriota bacterium]